MQGSMKKNYRGQFGSIISIVIILASAIVIYLFIALYTEKSSAQEAINTCRLSVISQSSSEILPTGTGLKSPIDLSCEKRYVKFYDNHVDIGLSPENMKTQQVVYNNRKVGKFTSLTDGIVDQVLAEEMRICKYQFADGKIEIFANNDEFFGDDNVCFVCSDITFSGVKTKNFNTLLEYSKNANIKGTGYTYYQYLIDTTAGGNPMWLQPYYISSPYNDLNIDSSKKYSVFVKKYSKLDQNAPDYLLDPLKYSGISEDDLLGWIKSGSVPVTVNIVPSEDLNKYCDIQAN